MSKNIEITIQNAVSANGFIAKSNGETPWQDDEWELFEKAMKEHSSICMGRVTYDEVKHDGTLDDYIGEVFVLTSKNEEQNSPEKIVELAKSKGHKNMLLIGGSKCNAAFLDAKLVDNIIIDFEPQIFNSGIPFVNNLSSHDLNLKLISSTPYGKSGLSCVYSVEEYL